VVGLINLGAFNFPSSVVPGINGKDVIEAVISEPPARGGVKADDYGTGGRAEKKDPLQKYYDRSYKAVDEFCAKYDPNYPRELNKNYLANKTRDYDDENVAKAFISGLASTLKKALSDKNVAQLTTDKHALDVAIDVLNTYESMFDSEYKSRLTLKASKEGEVVMKRAMGITVLGFAGGAFLAFLLLVFLIIFVKIELNLRKMAEKE